MTGRNQDRTAGWRIHFAALLESGPLACSKCGKPVTVDSLWDVDHLIDHVDGGRATADNVHVAHRVCNRRAGQAKAQARRKSRKRADNRTKRDW